MNLSNVDVEKVDKNEITIVIDQFTRQLKNSEYTCKETRNYVVDGTRGRKNKIERRKREEQPFYRLAKNTLHSRVKKKSMEEETWYRTENKTGNCLKTGRELKRKEAKRENQKVK